MCGSGDIQEGVPRAGISRASTRSPVRRTAPPDRRCDRRLRCRPPGPRRGVLEDPLALPLRLAPADPQHQVRVAALQLPQLAQTAVDLDLGLLPDGAGVQEDQVRLFRALRPPPRPRAPAAPSSGRSPPRSSGSRRSGCRTWSCDCTIRPNPRRLPNTQIRIPEYRMPTQAPRGLPTFDLLTFKPSRPGAGGEPDRLYGRAPAGSTGVRRGAAGPQEPTWRRRCPASSRWERT